MQEHSMTNTHPSPLVEDPYATYDLPTTWLLWVAAMVHGMEVGTEKSKIMTNSTNNIRADISTNGQKLEDVTSFKYLGTTMCKDCTCSAEVRIRIASAIAAVTGLDRI